MTDTNTRAGGVPVPVSVLVTTDHLTILGDGSAANPLRSGVAGASTFTATYVAGDSGLSPYPGMPVAISAVEPTVGIASVTPGTAASSEDDALADVIGAILLVGEDSVVVRAAGVISLTIAEWDAVTGESGGLTTRGEYYLSTSSGLLTQTPPTAPGTFFSRVGVALSRIALLLSTPTDPIQN